MSYEFWKQHQDELYQMYYIDGMSTTEIGKHFGCYSSTIGLNMKRMGYTLRKVAAGTRINAKYKIDSNYFNCIDTADKAYVLGFISSDGHVSKQGSLMFSQKDMDEDVLIKINQAMGSNYPITPKNKIYSNLTIHDEQIAFDLRRIGLNNTKSKWFDFHKVISHVPDIFIRDYIRGLFDGDGSICIYEYDYFKNLYVHFGFTGIIDSVMYVREYFKLETKIVDEGSGIFTCRSSDKIKIAAAGHKMYDDASIYMNRKMANFNKVYNLIS